MPLLSYFHGSCLEEHDVLICSGVIADVCNSSVLYSKSIATSGLFSVFQHCYCRLKNDLICKRDKVSLLFRQFAEFPPAISDNLFMFVLP